MSAGTAGIEDPSDQEGTDSNSVSLCRHSLVEVAAASQGPAEKKKVGSMCTGFRWITLGIHFWTKGKQAQQAATAG